jgi:hypothetical protein
MALTAVQSFAAHPNAGGALSPVARALQISPRKVREKYVRPAPQLLRVPGQSTAPNQCDVADDCVADPGRPSPNDRLCSQGPFEQFCSPVETFRGCTLNGDCTFAGDTCSLGKFRDCFDNGNLGDVVTATGNADPPVNHESDPTLAALFCIGPTSSSAVNSAAGLPGLGRLELTGHAVENGTP